MLFDLQENEKLSPWWRFITLLVMIVGFSILGLITSVAYGIPRALSTLEWVRMFGDLTFILVGVIPIVFAILRTFLTQRYS